jgi:drug/metabolite transporter (DMT)-like permease
VEGVVELRTAARPRVRRPVFGYVLVLCAASLFGVNGSVAKVALSSGLSSLRLTEARCAGAMVGLVLLALVRRPASLRVSRGELLRLALFGIVGVALVQLTYFLAIHRLPIGIALLIQFLGPLFVAIYARSFGHERVRRRIWAALACSIVGLALMVHVWNGSTLDWLGVAYALISAVIFAVYLLLAEREVAGRDSVSLMAWGMFFATVFWTLVQPWWSFPAGTVGQTVSLQGHLASWHLPVWALVLWIVVLGSVVPFSLVVAGLGHASATRVGIASMLEPVVATVIAWAWLGESLSAGQLAGAGVVLAGILLAQTAR